MSAILAMPHSTSLRAAARSLLLAGSLSLTWTEAWAQTQSPDWSRIAGAIVARLAPLPGEGVLLIARPGVADDLIEPLRRALQRAGARDLGAAAASGVTPAAWHTDFTRALAPARLAEQLGTVDAAIILPGAGATDPLYAAMQQALAQRGGAIRTIHFHWAGAYGLEGMLLQTTAAHEAVYQRALLETDYQALGRAQRQFETALRRDSVRVTTPAGTDLVFIIGDRPVTKQDGDASAARARQARNLIDRELELPAGAIRVAPLEQSVSGRIAFPAGEWGGERVEGLVLQLEQGRVVSFDARSGRDGVAREFERAGPAGRAFREFALGFNPLLAIPGAGERWIPYYGYGAGVVRLSLGDNSELGGAVTGGYVRWNFFTDATVTVGRDVWVRQGRLQLPAAR